MVGSGGCKSRAVAAVPVPVPVRRSVPGYTFLNVNKQWIDNFDKKRDPQNSETPLCEDFMTMKVPKRDYSRNASGLSCFPDRRRIPFRSAIPDPRSARSR